MSYPTSDVTSTSPSNSAHVLDELGSRLRSEPEKKQLQIIQQLEEFGAEGLKRLQEFLDERQNQSASSVTVIDGKIYQLLANADTPEIRSAVEGRYPHGIAPLNSDRGVDYRPLQEALVKQDFQTADRLTLQNLCELSGATAVQRKWLYFTEVDTFPIVDLQTINTLWVIYSEGKFGFSVQRDLWLGVGQDWDQLWPKIGWKSGNYWTRYPTEFTWDLSAPRGHLPLSNQLRGVRVFAALLSHPAWTEGAIAPN